MKEPVELNENVTRALRTLGRAPLPEGMEGRIIGQMRERQAELRAAVPRRSSWKRWALASACAASVVMIVLVSQHHAAPPATANHAAANLPSRDTARTATDTAPVETAATVIRRQRSPRMIHAGASQASAPSFTPPPLPLTQQEHLLLALAHAPQIEPALASVATSETVVNHGLGKNAIDDLDHEELKPLKTTLQLTQLSTLPKPNLSGENE